jgi:hypothetical protein
MQQIRQFLIQNPTTGRLENVKQAQAKLNSQQQLNTAGTYTPTKLTENSIQTAYSNSTVTTPTQRLSLPLPTINVAVDNVKVVDRRFNN